MSFEPRDYAEMHYFYGVARGNGHLAARLYREHVRHRGGPQPGRFPDHRVFINTHNAYIEGRIPGRARREGIPRAVPERFERVIQDIQRDPSMSTRQISVRTGIPRMSVQRVLRSVGYHPYRIKKVQSLHPADYTARVAFCQEMLRSSDNNPDFFDEILWTDESHFKREGVFNTHNYHNWAIENPHLTRASNFQHRFSVNLWSGILNRQLIGPFELPPRLDGQAYLLFLQNDLPALLEHVNLALLGRMWFQNDGAPCHFAVSVRQHLNETYRNRWIGRSGTISWPPRSPDLNPIDFFIWGCYKEIVYAKECANESELRQKLQEAENRIRQMPRAFVDLRSNFLRRCRLCIQVAERHFEQLL